MRTGLLLAMGCFIFSSFAAGEEYTGFIDNGETRSVSVILDSYQIYLVYLETPPAADFALSVYGPRDSMIGEPMKTRRLDGVLFSTPAADTYRIEVRSVSGSGNFTLSVVSVAIEDGSLKEGECWQYLLPLAYGDRCYLLLTPDSCDLNLFAYDHYNNLIAKSECPGVKPEELEFRAPLKGSSKYTIEVCARRGSGGYRLLLIYDKKIGGSIEKDLGWTPVPAGYGGDRLRPERPYGHAHPFG